MSALAPVQAADNPFQSLAGTWNGSGTANFEGGTKESLRCKGYYTNGSGGANLGLSIRCANASAKVELRANLNYANGAVTGEWEERTYNQSGRRHSGLDGRIRRRQKPLGERFHQRPGA